MGYFLFITPVNWFDKLTTFSQLIALDKTIRINDSCLLVETLTR